MSEITVRYHGHACFALEYMGFCLAIDPYAHGMVPGLPELKLEADAVFCSHGHGDHAFTEAVALKNRGEAVPWVVETVETDHDDKGGSLRGKNLIHIFRMGGKTLAHLGDLGHMPSKEVMSKLQGIDCMLIPVGGFYTIGPDVAEQIVREAKPKVTVPMHYRTEETGFDVLAHLTDFTKRFEQVKTCVNTYTLTGEEKEEVLVIHYKP